MQEFLVPVLGHAIVGIAAALTTSPMAPRNAVIGLDAWALALVFLSYLPDIAEQVVGVTDWSNATAFSHSLVFAAGAGGIVAPALARVGGTRVRTAAAVAFVVIIAHDFLDMLQSPDRMALWPFSSSRLSVMAGLIPASLTGELLVLSPILLAACFWWSRLRRPEHPVRRTLSWAWMLVVGIVASAVAVSHLRDVRHEDALRARALVVQRNYIEALAACDRADRWPSTASPGRLDYVRAEAWLGLGNRDRAEHYYLLSRRRDPTYFWTVADLAVFYASGAKPREDRRRDTLPWLQVLESDFAGHPALPRTVERVRRALHKTSEAR